MSSKGVSTKDAGVRCVQVLGFEYPMDAVDWSPDGSRLAVGDRQGSVEVLTSEGGRLWRQKQHQGYIDDIRWSPNGRQIASTSYGGPVQVWDASAGTVRFKNSGDGPAVDSSVAWSPDSQRLAWSCGSVFLFDANTGEEVDRWSKTGREVRSLAWSPDGRHLALGFFSGAIGIMDGESLSEIATLRGHTSKVRWLTWSPDGRFLASAAYDRTLRIWDIGQRRCRQAFDGHTSYVQSVSWSSKGDLLASGSSDNSVRLWDAQSGQQVVQLDEHQGTVWCVAFSPDGARLASASSDKTVRIWDVSALLPEVANPENSNLEAYAAGQATTVGRRATRKTRVSLWVPEIDEFRREDNYANGVAVSQDNRFLVVGFNNGSLRCIDLNRKAEVWRRDGTHDDITQDVKISRNGDIVASSSSDDRIGLWELKTGRLVRYLNDHDDTVWESTFSPQCDRLASASSDGSIKIWCLETGEVLQTMTGHEGDVNSVHWHPDGSILVSGSDDRSVRVWDVLGRKEVGRYDVHEDIIWQVSWSPDGERLASASEDGTVAIWNPKQQQELVRTSGHDECVNCVVWSPDGRLIASGGDDSAIRLWDPTTGYEVHRFDFEEEYAWRLSWATSGAFLVANLDNSAVRIFDTREFIQNHSRANAPTGEHADLVSELKPLPGVCAHLFRLGLPAPLSHLRSLLDLLSGLAQDEILAPLQVHSSIRQLIDLRWPGVARTGLLALLLKHLPSDARFIPPVGTPPAELRDALTEALHGKPIEPQAPTLPVAALLQAADTLDERLFTLLQLLGPDAVAADPGLPLRLLPHVPKLPPLTAPKRRLLGLRVDLDSRGPAHGHGPGAERTGLDLRGDLRGLLPSQLALPDSVLRARYHRGDLLYRTRDGQEPPKLRPTVILLDVSPPTFGPVESTTRLAAHAVATSLLEAGLPVVLVLAGGRTEVRVLERPADLIEIWTARSLEPANEVQALCLARAMAENLADGVLRPVVLLLSHPFFAADGAVPDLPSLRGLFVQYPKASSRPAMAEVCERWSSVPTGEAGGLEQHLGELVG